MKKILSVIFVFVILSLSVLSFSVSADEYNWSISKDGETLTNGSTVYKKYEMPTVLNYLPDGEVYLYEVESLYEEYYYDYVAVTQGTTDIVRLQYAEDVYVTEKGKNILDKLRNGEYSFYLYFADNDVVVDFVPMQFSLFISESNKTEIDVTQIWNCNIYEIRGFDETGTFAYDCGAVYEVNGEYYYIHYDELDNSYFDAYGAFSYRKGMAPAYKLDEAAVKFVENANFSIKVRIEEYIYPEEEWFLDADDDLEAMITFWVISLLFGLILPAVPLVLSIKFANSKKAIRPKRWYILTACSILWILTSVGMVLVIIL